MRILLVLMSLFVFIAPIFAMEAENEQTEPSLHIGSWQFAFDPNDQPYPDYVADPRRPRMGAWDFHFSAPTSPM